jgi:hypothetical protein
VLVKQVLLENLEESLNNRTNYEPLINPSNGDVCVGVVEAELEDGSIDSSHLRLRILGIKDGMVSLLYSYQG